MRRQPKKQTDGTFNYNPDVYCCKYDENTGICPDEEDCPYVHRNAGDTERRYHPRYFKTGICIYETNENGHCSKNGVHCAFAHGLDDVRSPVYDIREVQNSTKHNINLPASLEKERILNEDPKWNDMLHVLARYKTELCKKPPRMCRQGYACPFYHNGKDKRRDPSQCLYRSSPCPIVKPGDEWLDSGICEKADFCNYCHTRTEQQFHPEIYKSTKCNDILQNGYCPRGPFCAFAHEDSEMSIGKDFVSAESNAGGGRKFMESDESTQKKLLEALFVNVNDLTPVEKVGNYRFEEFRSRSRNLSGDCLPHSTARIPPVSSRKAVHNLFANSLFGLPSPVTTVSTPIIAVGQSGTNRGKSSNNNAMSFHSIPLQSTGLAYANTLSSHHPSHLSQPTPLPLSSHSDMHARMDGSHYNNWIYNPALWANIFNKRNTMTPVHSVASASLSTAGIVTQGSLSLAPVYQASSTVPFLTDTHHHHPHQHHHAIAARAFALSSNYLPPPWSGFEVNPFMDSRSVVVDPVGGLPSHERRSSSSFAYFQQNSPSGSTLLDVSTGDSSERQSASTLSNECEDGLHSATVNMESILGHALGDSYNFTYRDLNQLNNLPEEEILSDRSSYTFTANFTDLFQYYRIDDNSSHENVSTTPNHLLPTESKGLAGLYRNDNFPNDNGERQSFDSSSAESWNADSVKMNALGPASAAGAVMNSMEAVLLLGREMEHNSSGDNVADEITTSTAGSSIIVRAQLQQQVDEYKMKLKQTASELELTKRERDLFVSKLAESNRILHSLTQMPSAMDSAGAMETLDEMMHVEKPLQRPQQLPMMHRDCCDTSGSGHLSRSMDISSCCHPPSGSVYSQSLH